MLDGRYPSEEFSELRPRIVWDRVEDTIRARKGALQLAVTNAGTIPDRGLFGVHLPDGRRVGELDEEMVYEARARPDVHARRLHLADRGDHPRPRDRDPRPRRARARVPFWRGDGVGRPAGARPGDRRVLAARPSTASPRSWRRSYDLDERAAQQPRRLPARAARGHAGDPLATARSWSSASATRSATGGCACSRPSAGACTPPGALALSRAHPRRVRPRVRRHLVRRRDHRPPARRRRAARGRPGARRARRARGPGGARAVGSSALYGARFRENAARALLLPARPPGQAHAAVAAAAEGAVAAGGGQALRPVPDRARDLPRVPARRARPARPPGAAARPAHARAVAGGGRDPARLPVRLLAAVRLRGHLHVRGRHARTPSGARPPSRSTATCCASCSARRSCAT